MGKDAVEKAKQNSKASIQAVEPTPRSVTEKEQEVIDAQDKQATEQETILTTEEKALQTVLQDSLKVYRAHEKADGRQSAKLNVAAVEYIKGIVEKHDKDGINTALNPADLKSHLYVLAGYTATGKERIHAFEMAVVRTIKAALLHWNTQHPVGSLFKISTDEKTLGELQCPKNLIEPTVKVKSAIGKMIDTQNNDDTMTRVPVADVAAWFAKVYPELTKKRAAKTPAQTTTDAGEKSPALSFEQAIDGVLGYLKSHSKAQDGYPMPSEGEEYWNKLSQIEDYIAAENEKRAAARAEVQAA